ncbi:M48 family peptidase [bacterium]|nr:M48 family peptidase [bacterium]
MTKKDRYLTLAGKPFLILPNIFIRLCFLVITSSLLSCASTRAPLVPGEIPKQASVAIADEQYGQKVFGQLAEQFDIETDDNRILRVRNIVDTLTQVEGNHHNIWHVHVFKDDSFYNAAATRGNYIFVWSPLIDLVSSDDELATILSHEIAHVLAKHTQPDPIEEAKRIITGITSETARQAILQSASSAAGSLANLGAILTAELLKALLINPNQQALELEADQLGLFIMAKAGYDPRSAIQFWERMAHIPEFQQAPIEFLSSHPSSETRLKHLKKLLPLAQKSITDRQINDTVPYQKSAAAAESQKHFKPITPLWKVIDDGTPVFSEPHTESSKTGALASGTLLQVDFALRRWLFITEPYEGYVHSSSCVPTR